MPDWKARLAQEGLKLMSNPQVMRLAQDERVMKAVMQLASVPGKVQTFAREQAENLAKSLSLATEDEVKDLRRTVRHLEDELARMDAKRTVEKRAESDRRAHDEAHARRRLSSE